MKKRGQYGMGAAAAAALLAAASPLTVLGAAEIRSVSLEFTLEGWNEDGTPSIEADTNGTKYGVEGFYTAEEFNDLWGELNESEDDEQPDTAYRYMNWNVTYSAIGDQSEIVYVVLLEAGEGNTFYANESEIRCYGLGAQCVAAERMNDRELLAAYVKFGDLDDQLGEMGEISWEGNGRARWPEVPGAARYELKLEQPSTGLTLAKGKTTSGTSYDLAPFMQQEGGYICQVRAVSASGETGEWKSSPAYTATAQTAADNRSRYALISQGGAGNGPEGNPVYMNTGWQQGAGGAWWYRETDGGYPQNNWLEEDGSWYFFDENGYMKTNAYVQWEKKNYYVGEDGRMAVNSQTPDGRVAGMDGSLEWPAY